jgi:hypothetical protein
MCGMAIDKQLGSGTAEHGSASYVEATRRKARETRTMVTNYPQQLTATAADRETASDFVARAATRLGQLLCGMRGHETMMHFEEKRVTMRCAACGHDTPGWELSDRSPRKRFDGDERRHRLATPRIVLRKTA